MRFKAINLAAFLAVAASLTAALPGRGAAHAAGYTCPLNFGTCLGVLAAGTHKTTSFQPALTYTVPAGWTNFCDHTGALCFVPPGGNSAGVDNGTSDYVDVFTSIAASPTGCPTTAGTIHTPQRFVHRLERLRSLTVSRPAAVTIGGLSGYVIDLRLRKNWKTVCAGFNPPPFVETVTGLPPSPSDLSHGIGPQPQVQRLYLLNYKGGTLGIELFARKGSAKLSSYSSVVKTFHFTVH